jgi:hypothetical protein
MYPHHAQVYSSCVRRNLGLSLCLEGLEICPREKEGGRNGRGLTYAHARDNSLPAALLVDTICMPNTEFATITNQPSNNGKLCVLQKNTTKLQHGIGKERIT